MRQKLAIHAMKLTSLFAVAFSIYKSYCYTFLYQPEMPKALMDQIDQ